MTNNNELVYAAFFYVPDVTVGHGWNENYKKIIEIFCNSATHVGLIPLHIHPKNVEPITDQHFVCSNVDAELLMYHREIAYAECVDAVKVPIILSDPDQVFVQKPPPLYNHHARVIYRPRDYATFNGPRMYVPGFSIIQKHTIDRMSMMLPRYKAWDGDSLAFADAVREHLFMHGKNTNNIHLADSNEYISRPAFFTKDMDTKSVYMMHFKGNSGKREMLEFGKKHGLI